MGIVGRRHAPRPDRKPAALPVSCAASAATAPRDDAGFSLIEVVVATAIVLAVMAATTGFFLRSMALTSLQQQRQGAVTVANQAMERVRAVPASRLLTGRDSGRVASLRAAPGAVSISDSVAAWDPTATGASTPVVPFTVSGSTDPDYRVGNVNYTVRTFVDGCYLPPSGGACGATQPAGSKQLYRVTVDVQWTPGRGTTCGGGGCEYVVSTLRDPSTDSLFNINATPGGTP